MNVDKPLCKYGKKCYCKNPIHFEEFSHPGTYKMSTIIAKRCPVLF